MPQNTTPETRSVRLLRVGEQVRHILSEVLMRGDVHDETVTAHSISITEVRMSPDLKHAIVFVRPLLARDEAAVLKALRTNTAYFQAEVAKRVNLKYAAKLKFLPDESFEEGARIDALLRSPTVARDLDGTPDGLGAPLARDDIALIPLGEEHRAALKAACAEDREIWPIYSVSWAPDQFDAQFDALRSRQATYPFAILYRGKLIGMTAFLGHLPDRQTVEIGNSYIVPAVRGTGLNRRVKHLLLARAFAGGIRRVEFRIDDRNARSKAAVRKLGAVQDGLLRAERVTWTGHIRDTALFSILSREWQE